MEALISPCEKVVSERLLQSNPQNNIPVTLVALELNCRFVQTQPKVADRGEEGEGIKTASLNS